MFCTEQCTEGREWGLWYVAIVRCCIFTHTPLSALCCLLSLQYILRCLRSHYFHVTVLKWSNFSSPAQIISPLILYRTHCMKSLLTRRYATLTGDTFLKGVHDLRWFPLVWGTISTLWHFYRNSNTINSVFISLFLSPFVLLYKSVLMGV